MLDGWLYLAFFFGVSGIGLLIFLTLKHNRPKPRMQDGFNIFFTTSSIAPGLKICWYSISSQFFSQNDLDRFYIFGGGLAVIWLAVDNIVDLLKTNPNRNVTSNSNSVVTTPQSGSNTASNIP